MLKIASLLASVLLSSSVFADPAPSPYPDTQPPSKKASTTKAATPRDDAANPPGGDTSRLSNDTTDDNSSKNAKVVPTKSKEGDKDQELLKNQGDNE